MAQRRLKGLSIRADAVGMATSSPQSSGSTPESHGRRFPGSSLLNVLNAKRGLDMRRVVPVPSYAPAEIRQILDSKVPDGMDLFRDIDLSTDVAPYVIAGRRGVFAVDVHVSRRKVSAAKKGLTIGGKASDDLVSTATARAHLLAELTGTAVRPVVAFAGADVNGRMVGAVAVTTLDNLRTHLINEASDLMSWDEFKRVRQVLAEAGR